MKGAYLSELYSEQLFLNNAVENVSRFQNIRGKKSDFAHGIPNNVTYDSHNIWVHPNYLVEYCLFYNVLQLIDC